MIIKTTKQEFVQMVNSLFAVKDLKGKEFAVAVAKNLDILTKNLKDLEEAGKPSKEFMELAMSVNAFTDDPNDESKIYEIDKLEKDNKELIDERRAQLDNVAKLMEEEIEITIKPLTIEMLPEDITAQQMSSLTKFIE
jgi:hypothetical protein|tara:strand:- start:39810 stop:40223 length:414 start_codon:yes stop_codon:yes gene_type:complete